MQGKFHSLEAYPAVSLLVDVSHPGDLPYPAYSKSASVFVAFRISE